jgi:hypothetical protein
MISAREFLEEVAEILRSKGREVEITETEESFGTFVWLYAPAPKWYERSMSLSAARSGRTGRWRLGPLSVGSTCVSPGFERNTRSKIKTAADVYG